VVAPTTEKPVRVLVLAERWMGCLVSKGDGILLAPTYLSLGALDITYQRRPRWRRCPRGKWGADNKSAHMTHSTADSL